MRERRDHFWRSLFGISSQMAKKKKKKKGTFILKPPNVVMVPVLIFKQGRMH